MDPARPPPAAPAPAPAPGTAPAPPPPPAAVPAPSYSTTDAAQRLGVSAPTVQRWVDLGHLKAWKTVGGHRRIDAASVEQFLAEQTLRVQPPAPPAVPDTPAAGAPAEAAGAAAPAPSAGPAVLIVDDNPDDRDLLAALVEHALPGARIRLAENGFQALVALGRALPDILVTDIVMPHMDGLEMLRHLAGTPDSTPRRIVVVTSQPLQALDALRAIAPGVPVVPKPVDAAGLAAALLEPAPEPKNTNKTE